MISEKEEDIFTSMLTMKNGTIANIETETLSQAIIDTKL